MALDAGWDSLAAAYIGWIDDGDPNRTVLLDPVMLEQCGDVRGRCVLDLGCGEGRFCRMLAERGALPAGIDPTRELIEAAHGRGGQREHYVRCMAESLPLKDATFDLAVSYVTLVDIEGYAAAIAEAARVLRRGGAMIVANLGFVTASDGWQRDDSGNRLFHRVDRYAEERPWLMEWQGHRLMNWHRPLANYMRAYLRAGLVLEEFLEPVPVDQSLRDDPYFEDWYRVPLFNVMRWRKP